MKKVIFRSVLICLAFIMLLLTGVILIRHKEHKQYAQRISHLPEFTLSTLDGKTFNSSDILSGPVLIIHFHPECEHCQYEIGELFKHAGSLTKTRLILISGAPENDLAGFLNQYSYSLYPNISILVDTADTFGSIFRNDIIPSHFLYNKKLDLVKVFPGEYKLETILRYIDEEGFAK